jgi:hypothetical protein
MIFDIRNPLHILWLWNGRAQPPRAWRQRNAIWQALHFAVGSGFCGLAVETQNPSFSGAVILRRADCKTEYIRSHCAVQATFIFISYDWSPAEAQTFVPEGPS